MAAKDSTVKNADFAKRAKPLLEAIAKRIDNIPDFCPAGLRKEFDKLKDSITDALKKIDAPKEALEQTGKRIPAPEKQVKSIAERIQKELGKDARREFHDLKDKALGDRTMSEAIEDAISLYENAGKEVPRWLLDRLN